MKFLKFRITKKHLTVNCGLIFVVGNELKAGCDCELRGGYGLSRPATMAAPSFYIFWPPGG